MGSEEYSALLDSAFQHGTPFINYMEFYSYALIPQGDSWLEVAYDFNDHEILDKHTLSHEEAWLHFCEEVEKAMSDELKVFYLNKWRDFKTGLQGDEKNKLEGGIKELLANPTTYSDKLPVIFTPADLTHLKGKL